MDMQTDRNIANVDNADNAENSIVTEDSIMTESKSNPTHTTSSTPIDSLSEWQQCLQQDVRFSKLKFPNPQTVVLGALDAEKIKALGAAGAEVVINLQPDTELAFDEQAEVQANGMVYASLPITDANDLKQVNLLAFDRLMRQYQGKKMVMHCKTGNRVGACMALRAGWLRGRKMETAIATGKAHGLQGLEQEVHNRLLVPR